MTPAVQMIYTALPAIPEVAEGDDLVGIVEQGLDRAGIRLEDGDVLAITSKIVSKSEGRLVKLSGVHPSAEAENLTEETGKDPALLEVILGESRRVVRRRKGLVIVEHKLGFVCANAGVDQSNLRGEDGESQGWALLLPQDPDRSARDIRDRLESASGARIGIIIIDSHGRPWRRGTSGVTVGLAGFPALVDLRGQPDRSGRILRITQVGLADEVAAGASALMGQADEGRPVVHIRGLPYPLRDGSMRELIRSQERDLFR